jgi:hypothetical protein
MPYGSGAPADGLQSIAHTRIADGRLPILPSATVEAGYGSGTVCRLCEEPIYPDQVEYQVKDARDGTSLSFHLICHAAWQLACAE